MKITYVIILVTTCILFVIWLGFSIRPALFPPYTEKSGEVKTIPLPSGLPKPVERYYRVVYGDEIPVIKSVVITGHAIMRPAGPFFLPVRFRFTHVAGSDYRHYIEVTFFNLPIMKVNERYVDGSARMELPFGTDEGGNLNQAANLGLWAETAWFPAVFLTTPGVEWREVDENTALLVVPFEKGTDSFIVRFDPETGYPEWFESMRYHDSKSTGKVLWLNHSLDIREIDGKMTSTTGSSTWMDDGKPWAYFSIDDIVFNVNVDDYVRQRGL